MEDVKERSRSRSRRARYEALRRQAEQAQQENSSIVDLFIKSKALAN